MLNIKRNAANPVVTKDQLEEEACAVFNPGVIYENGKYYLFTRRATSLRPFICSINLMESFDGVNFTESRKNAVITAKSLGYEKGSLEDPRVVKIGEKYLMTFAFRPVTWDCSPTGLGVPDYEPLIGKKTDKINNTLTAIVESTNMLDWTLVSIVNETSEYDDRDVILFPELINGKYAILRRPLDFVGKNYGVDKPSIWISYSKDLKAWSEPQVVASPKYSFEKSKIGGGGTPLKTKDGWLIIYHGVNEKSVYSVGAMLLDLNDPTKVKGRIKNSILEPELYYERTGLVIPDVIFPSGTVIVDGIVKIYYGCCDTSIALAEVNLNELLEKFKTEGEVYE